MSSSFEFTLWVMVFVYAGHILEEYTLDWKSWAEDLSGFRLGWENFWAINAAVIVFGVCCAMIGWQSPAISLIFPTLAIINGLFFHIAPTFIQRRISPGVITSALFFLPVGFWVFWGAQQDQALSLQTILLAIIGGAFVMAYPILLLRLKDKLKTKES